MRCTAILADSVAAAEGKLYVQGGGWTTIWAPGVPLRWPRIGIALQFFVPWLDANDRHTFSLRLEDEDGRMIPLGIEANDAGEANAITTLGGEFVVGRPPGLPDGEDQSVPIAVNLDGIELPMFGAYRIVIDVDGTHVATLRFRVARAPSSNE